MDDPWRSPWESSGLPSKPDEPSPSPPKSLLSPPPRAFFGSATNLTNQSPWTDEDAFGGWASQDPVGSTNNPTDWSVWSEAAPASSRLGSPQKPNTAATSPRLRPLPRSRASSIFRHHSPDPWAAETSMSDHMDTPLSDSIVVRPADDVVTGPDAAAGHDSTAMFQSDDGFEYVMDGKNDNSPSAEMQEPTKEHDNYAWDTPVPKKTSISVIPSVESGPNLETHEPPSRPSSTFSIDSRNTPERQDSPITSIDEDPNSRPQTNARKVSGKVQELVGMFDGLAKAASEEPPVLERRQSTPSKTRESLSNQEVPEHNEDLADFGDFEEAFSPGQHAVPTTSTPSISSDTSLTPKTHFKESYVEREDSGPDKIHVPVPKAAPISIPRLVEKFGPVSFDINLQTIDELFPLFNEPSDDTIGSDEIPDRVVTDSFTTISERKTWYRISRLGSMRKHDSGDEDNYRRVTWPASQLHKDTIKIVRRWMEEDSFAGRATLGGSKASNAFNWDSSAAPIDLNTIFARKQSSQHARTGSVPLPGVEQISFNSNPEPKDFNKDSFGRENSISEPTTTPSSNSTLKLKPHELTSVKKSGGSNGHESELVLRPNRPASVAPSSTVQAATSRSRGNSNDDNDDWGEMVSSPQNDAHPPIGKNDNTNPEVAASVRTNESVPKLSLAIPQTIDKRSDTKNEITPPGARSARTEPWPLADFSFFEKPTHTSRAPKQDPWPLADLSIFESPTSRSKSNWLSALKFPTKSRAKDSPAGGENSTAIDTGLSRRTEIPPNATMDNPGGSDEDRRTDEVVLSILQNLPDLSYMLR